MVGTHISDTATVSERKMHPRVKRRGLIAGATALLATLVTRQAMQPVAAHAAQDILLGGTHRTANDTVITNTVTTNGLGRRFQGKRAPLRLVPVVNANGSPTCGTYQAGEFFVDGSGALFYCIVAGTPGTWINLSSPAIPTITEPVNTSATTNA